MPRHASLLRLLRASLLLGALYDYAFALLMVLAPEVPARLLHLPTPGEAFYLWLMAILLAMVATCYLLPFHDPWRYQTVVPIAIVGRALGGLAFLAAAWGRADLAGLYPLAAADLGFAAAHAGGWLPIRR